MCKSTVFIQKFYVCFKMLFLVMYLVCQHIFPCFLTMENSVLMFLDHSMLVSCPAHFQIPSVLSGRCTLAVSLLPSAYASSGSSHPHILQSWSPLKL